jgi:tetratricopeptide (TPR) repeat protein
LIAKALLDTHDNEGALAAYRDAVSVRQKVAEARPGVIPAQSALADILLETGRLLVQCGKSGDAISYFDRQEKIWTNVVDANPTLSEYKHRLVQCQLNAAAILLGLGRPADSRARCQRAVAQSEFLLSSQPNGHESRLALARALLRLGQAHRADGDVAAATAVWTRAIALIEEVSDPSGEQVFVHACCHAGLASVTALAGVTVSAANPGTEISRTMALLRQAAGLGYRDLKTYRTETALDPVRSRPDFLLLMMDLAMPPDPFAEGR